MTTLYVHRSCFDGIASGALATLFLEKRFARRIEKVVPVDYDVRFRWKEQVSPDACIVDFLYHPRAAFWWDHHANPFVEGPWEIEYRKRQGSAIRWNPEAPSCARLVANEAAAAGLELPGFVQATVRWADKIDTARYESPSEAVSTGPAAKQLALSLAVDRSADYHATLIKLLTSGPMEKLVTRSECRDQCRLGVARYEKGLRNMESNAKLDQDVVIYRLRLEDEIIDRMMPYYLFPEANFSLGIVMQDDQLKVSCNSNPWTKPWRINVGEVFSTLGGGGHRDVGSVIVLEGGQQRAEHILEHARIRLIERVNA